MSERPIRVSRADIPAGLSPIAELAARRIVDLLETQESNYTGGCRPFYTPEEWQARGERFCRDAALIVVYDGGELGTFFRMGDDDGAYALMAGELKDLGYTEEGTGWYTGFYPTLDVTKRTWRPFDALDASGGTEEGR